MVQPGRAEGAASACSSSRLPGGRILDSTSFDAVADPRRSDADRERDKTGKPVAVLSFFGLKP